MLCTECKKNNATVFYQQSINGESGSGAALVPNYLRLSQAERERKAREQQKE